MRAEPEVEAIHQRLIDRIERDALPEHYLLVVSSRQILQLCTDGSVLQQWRVSTAINGLGCADGSYKTPSGLHQISEKIGMGAAPGLLFRSRLAQPLCATIEATEVCTGVDSITSRILRLRGLESGYNQGEGCDSFARYIYIHGTAEEGLLGRAVSHGCVRMGNGDVIELARRIADKSLVFIF